MSEDIKSASSAKTGKIFLDSREELGLTSQQVAEQAVMNIKYIEGIESGDYSIFPSEGFARAYFIKYQKFLSLDCTFPPIYEPENRQEEIVEKSIASLNRTMFPFITGVGIIISLFILIIIYNKFFYYSDDKLDIVNTSNNFSLDSAKLIEASILNLKKDIADIVVPKNDAFIQFDFNGAEIRTLLSLSGEPQPKEDIHEFNAKILKCSRDKAKKKFFAWFYNPNKKNQELAEFYKRDKVLENHYINGVVQTPFGRRIETDDFHSFNYLLQSSSSDNCLAQAIKINKFLSGRRSFVHSVVHDSITIDLDKTDRDLITHVRQIFEDTRLGHFKSSMHIGKNYRDMEEV